MITKGFPKVTGHGRRTERIPRGWLITCICGQWSACSRGYIIARDAYRDAHLAEARAEWRCRVCKEETPVERRAAHSQAGRICKTCITTRTRDWADKNRDQFERARHDSHLRLKFGITVDDYERMLERQGGVCAGCRKPATDSRGYRPHVDHDHATGLVRGILCNCCNRALGQVGDNIDTLLGLVAYLRAHAESVAV